MERVKQGFKIKIFKSKMKKIITLFLFCILLISNTIKAQSGESPITLELPETAYIGIAVPYSGASVLYKDFKTVKINITGPKNYTTTITQNLNKDGKFNSYWVTPTEFGVYTFIAISSDGKGKDTSKIRVESIDLFEKMADESIALIEKAEKIVDKKANEIQSKITAADKKTLDEKLKKFKANIQQYNSLFKSIKEASKQIKPLLKSGQSLPRHIAHHLNDLNVAMDKQETEFKRVNEYYNHTPSNYTICDYLNGFKEVLAAYSTITSFAQKSVKTILTNIVANNVVPPAFNKAYDVGSAAKGNEASDGGKFISGEISKLYTAPLASSGTLDNFMGKVGFASDILGFIVDVLIKNYCFTFTNKITQENKFTFTNEYDEKWYVYKTKLEGILSLRAPKADGTSNIIKMKGSIEGNLTSYKAFADPKACIAKELKEQGVFDKTICFPLVEINPVVIPFSTAANDVGGFGWGARMVATPACFNIPVDAEYDVAKKEIKLFIIKAGAVDFTPAVKFRQLFMYIAVLPMTQYQDYPIEKAAITFFANFKEKNIFPIVSKGKEDKTFSGNVKRTVKDSGFNIDLSVTIEPEK
jgi:hypothetical protein